MHDKTRLLPLIVFFISHNLLAEETTFQNRLGLSYIVGQMVTPENDSYNNAINLSYLTPYTIFLPKAAPEYIRLRKEFTIAKVSGDIDGIYASAVFMAVRYLNNPPESTWRPYLEAGIGLGYASYRIEGQAYKVNFNPQFGFGSDYTTSAGNTYFSSIRVSHFSNGNLNKDNKGINNLNIAFGRYF